MGEKREERALEYSKTLKLSNAEKNKIVKLCTLYNLFNNSIYGFTKEVKHLLCEYDSSLIFDIFHYLSYDTCELLEFITNGSYKMSDLSVNGTHIVDTGLFKSNQISAVLKSILKAVADGSLENNQCSILEFVKLIAEDYKE